MDYLTRLKALKEERDLTNAEIAELSDIPLATVTRIFNGATPNPQFETIARITIALGGSLDVIAGLKSPNDKPNDSNVEKTLASYAELLREKDERIKEKDSTIETLKDDRKHDRKEKGKLMLFIGAFVGVVLFILIFDMMNGHMGYFRY